VATANGKKQRLTVGCDRYVYAYGSYENFSTDTHTTFRIPCDVNLIKVTITNIGQPQHDAPPASHNDDEK
jgi:hypothetical protein